MDDYNIVRISRALFFRFTCQIEIFNEMSLKMGIGGIIGYFRSIGIMWLCVVHDQLVKTLSSQKMLTHFSMRYLIGIATAKKMIIFLISLTVFIYVMQ